MIAFLLLECMMIGVFCALDRQERDHGKKRPVGHDQPATVNMYQVTSRATPTSMAKA